MIIPSDFERRAIDLAREVLADIPECGEPPPAPAPPRPTVTTNGLVTVVDGRVPPYRATRGAELKVRWFTDPMKRQIPALIVAFNIPETADQPACMIALASISKSTGALSLMQGERLQSHVRRSIDNYLNTCGITLNPGARFAG